MKLTEIKSCYIGPQISPEQFIKEHFFLYLIKGKMNGYDGNREYVLNPGEYCMICKNHLTRYNKEKNNGEFEKVVIIYDEPFLKQFKEKHQIEYVATESYENAFFLLKKHKLVPNYINSLEPYYNNNGDIDETFSELKREELLLILLKTNPELNSILFDFGIPSKIDLESFMNRNYKFNVSMERFAYLTGRSLSSFKRDFKQIFNDTPGRWLQKRRLQEAYFQLKRGQKKPLEIYLELGFEDLSHFSFAFKKLFNISPSEVSSIQ
jgi:AraC-like DNA-binding protein